ncbi:DUF4129 domain-containing protein [Sphingomonas sp. LHG3406-1]|uniref:DUF4129 domain-containing protein n=1 Tax=Sphingomonas sp. LHG3406-1 TaxID=2804617 RepID=UPI0026326412|nr:DUF4129 domain-containing protein [Sphingomonas sp. LHG3406-1]
MNGQTAAQPFDQAWKSLKADETVQFELTPAPPEPRTPDWIEKFGEWLESVLRPIGRFIAWLFSWLPDAAYARILLITLLVAGALFLLWIVAVRVKEGEWKLPWRRDQPGAHEAAAADVEWQPEDMPARAWLDEADALAREGRFAEAVHCLLLRSVDDMARRRPDAVRPAMTSRELARSSLLPERARGLFAGLARTVEQSLFGGRPVAEPGWREARDAYAQFALAGTWRS